MLVDFKNPCGSHKVIKMKALEGEGGGAGGKKCPEVVRHSKDL